MSRGHEELLTEEQIETLRDALDRHRDEVARSLATSRTDAKPVDLGLPIGRLTRMDALQQQHMAAARRQRLELQLQQILQALNRLDAGTYGECLRCGDPIAYSRLRACPETSFCLHCQRARPR